MFVYSRVRRVEKRHRTIKCSIIRTLLVCDRLRLINEMIVCRSCSVNLIIKNVIHFIYINIMFIQLRFGM